MATMPEINQPETSAPKLPLVVSVILNTNRRDDTLECLRSLAQSTYENHREIVLDNGSSDGSVEVIQAEMPQVRIIRLEKNLGYAGNNNVGIEAALEIGADWVFVLNEDTILDAHCIERLVSGVDGDPRVGVVGPLVYHHDEPQVIQSAGGRLDHTWQSIHIGQNEPDLGQFPAPLRVDWITGCSVMFRRAVIEQVGMLDERFFYYWEEVDWCRRAAEAGWELMVIPGARLWHKGVSRNYAPSANVTYYATRNRLLLMHKHHASSAAWAQVLGEQLRTLAGHTYRSRRLSPGPHGSAILQGIGDYFRGRWGMRRTK